MSGLMRTSAINMFVILNGDYFNNSEPYKKVDRFKYMPIFFLEKLIGNKLISNKVSKYIKHRGSEMMVLTGCNSSYSDKVLDNKHKSNTLTLRFDCVSDKLSDETESVYFEPLPDIESHVITQRAPALILTDTSSSMSCGKFDVEISRMVEALEEINRDKISLYDNSPENECYFGDATFWQFEKYVHKLSHRTLNEMLFNADCLTLSVGSSSNLTSHCLVDSTSEKQVVLDKYRNETDISEPEEVSIFCEKVNALLVRLINLSINCVFDEDVKIRFMGEEVFINLRLKSEWIYTLHEVDSFKEKILFTLTRYQDAKNIRKRKVPFYKTQPRDCINQNLIGCMEPCTIH